jgi:fructose-specific PTS system IIA-like component
MGVGATIEVPAAAFMIGALARVFDFFSIGTNDLLQCFFAADRTNPRVAPLANPLEPAFLRLLDLIVTEAHRGERWVGLCGELGGQPRYLPLLVGLGLDEISMASPEVAATKALLSGLSAARCRELAGRAFQASTAAEVAHLLDDRGHWRPQPLLEPDLVALDVEAYSKEEAIKAAVDLLYAAGRTDLPREVEHAVWRSEASARASGVGHGFAVTHCRTDAVAANSMAVVRLRTGVRWWAEDEPPVRTIVLVAVRPAGHATTPDAVMAALAHHLVREEFRLDVERAQDAESMCAALQQGLGTGLGCA